MNTLNILYSDNHLLAVVKPAGVLSQGDATGDLSLLELARTWVKREFDKPGKVYLGLVHRLDRPVGGVMVFARTSKAASRLSAQFRDRTVVKCYTALVFGNVAANNVTLQGRHEGKEESLTYSTVQSGEDTTLLDVRPHSGRKHQIRRQLANAGHPIVGDLRYGATEPLPERRIALYSHTLTLEHPTRKTPVEFNAPLPSWWPETT